MYIKLFTKNICTYTYIKYTHIIYAYQYIYKCICIHVYIYKHMYVYVYVYRYHPRIKYIKYPNGHLCIYIYINTCILLVSGSLQRDNNNLEPTHDRNTVSRGCGLGGAGCLRTLQWSTRCLGRIRYTMVPGICIQLNIFIRFRVLIDRLRFRHVEAGKG